MATLSFPNGKTLSNIELIMMDKDGTIFDIHHYWCSMIRLRANILSEKFASNDNHSSLNKELCSVMGIDHETNKLRPEGPIGIKPRNYITEVVGQCLIDHNIQITAEDVEAIFKFADQESEKDLASFLSILDGVETFINNCISHGVILTIATTDIERRAIAALKSKKLLEHFKLVLGADSVEKTKPSPFMAIKTLETFNIKKEKAVMIGDHTVDINFANNSLLKGGIGVSTGLLDFPSLLESSEYIVTNLNEIGITPDEN